MSFNLIILAAGFGTRLGKYGLKTPKGLITVGQTTLLDRLLSAIKPLHPVNTILMTNALHAPLYQTWLKASAFTDVTLLDNQVKDPQKRSGALADLSSAIDHLPQKDLPLLVAPSDTLFEFDVNDFIQLGQKHPDGLTTVFRDFESKASIQNRLGCGVIKAGRLTQFIEKPELPPTTFGAIPFYYYPKGVIPLLAKYLDTHPSLTDRDAPGSLIPWLLDQGQPVYAYLIHSQTRDVGTLADVNALNP